MSERKPVVTSLVAGVAELDNKNNSDKPSQKTKVIKSANRKSGSNSRRKSRELVLKAVYRGMLNQSDLAQVFRDMLDDPDYNKADESYFRQLLQSVTANVNEIDSRLVDFIDRPIVELSPVEHAILRIAGCELMFDLSIPYRVVINEGVELAKLFGGTDGHKYINGVLDKFAASVREQEVKAARS